jgi:N-acetylglutamate synthase-like GNAT family acetyltransferase
MGSEVSLRRADANDCDAARVLIGELGYGGHDRETFARGFTAALADAAQAVFVAERDTKVVGLLTISWRPQVRLAGLVVSIDELVVTEGARGLGIGARLLDVAKSEATRLGARRTELHTQRTRVSYTRGFYAKHGFVEIDSAVMRWEGAMNARIN